MPRIEAHNILVASAFQRHHLLTMKHDLPAFALLIDADNAQQESLVPIMEEITRHARVTVRRIYGDFTTPHLAGWKLKLAEHAIHPIQQYRNTIGKNASDSALIIDAMDLLHSRRFEGFCLVSSDSDFTRLATRIREDGLIVYGFGQKHAPKAFVSACDRYIYIENLISKPEQERAIDTISVVKPSPTRAENLENQEPQPQIGSLQVTPPPPALAPSSKPPTFAVNQLLRAYTNVADDIGWAMLGQMSTYIHANHPDFDPRTYGCQKFSELVQKTEAFIVELRPYKNGQVHFCHPRGITTRTRPEKTAEPLYGSSKAFQKILESTVTQAMGGNGWASISAIGQKLKAKGHTVKEFGHSTLTDALRAVGLFEMQGNGAARYFRLKDTSPSKGP